MKKAVCIAVCLLTLLLCGCTKKEQNDMKTIKSSRTVTFVNGMPDADVWILPETEQNLKTTVWGTASASEVKTGESRPTPLCEPGDNGLYLFRMIDVDGFYYSVSSVTLQAGWRMQIKGEDLHAVVLEVTDENGDLQNAYTVFAARL